MQLTDKDGNVFGSGGLEITTSDGKPKIPVISTDITIGTTAIIGGVVNRILFQGIGDVVQESPNITWDNTNKIFKVATGTQGIVLEGDASGYPTFKINTLRSGTTRRNWMFATEQINAGDFVFYRSATGGAAASTLVYSIFNDGNFGLNTSVNAGFKFDVLGTTRLNGNITGIGTLGITIPSVNSFANGSITATPASWGRPYAVDFTIGAYTLSTMDNEIHFGARNGGVFFKSSQMYTVGILAQIWGGPTGPNNCSSLHIGVNSTGEYQTGTNYPSTADNYFYLSTVMVAANGNIYSPPRATPTRRKFIFSALELIFHTGAAGIDRGRIFANGNWAINTSVDTGYMFNVNGTGYFANNLRVNGTITAATPTASSYICTTGLAANQSVAGGVDTVIDFVDVDDAYNWWNPTTKKFTPNIQGYYHIDFVVWFDAANLGTAQYNTQIRKNGNTAIINQQPTANSTTGQSLTISKVIFMNGTTDSLDFTVYQGTPTNKLLLIGANYSGTYFTAHLIAL